MLGRARERANTTLACATVQDREEISSFRSLDFELVGESGRFAYVWHALLRMSGAAGDNLGEWRLDVGVTHLSTILSPLDALTGFTDGGQVPGIRRRGTPS